MNWIDGLSQNQSWQKCRMGFPDTDPHLGSRKWQHRSQSLSARFIGCAQMKVIRRFPAICRPSPFICGISITACLSAALRALRQHTHIHLMFTNPLPVLLVGFERARCNAAYAGARKPAKAIGDKKPSAGLNRMRMHLHCSDFEADGEQEYR